MQIDAFNTIFSELGKAVERQDIKSECAATLAKLSKKDVIMVSTIITVCRNNKWLIDWLNKQ
jgi:hypothetical protein